MSEPTRQSRQTGGDALRTVARLCGAVGVVLLLSAPLSFLLVGGLGPLVWGKLLLGGLLTAVYGFADRTVLSRLVGSRSAAMWAIAAVTSGSVVAAIVAINVLVVLHPHELDLTADEIHTLAPQTRELLQRLDVDVTIYAFYSDSEPQHHFVGVRLRRYAMLSDRIRYELVNPNARPDLIERFDVRITGPRVVVVAAGKQARAADGSEQELTNAIIKAAEQAQKTIYFITGHGEAKIDDRGPDGFEIAATAVRNDGYDVATMRLLDPLLDRDPKQSGDGAAPLTIPKDAGPLVIAGARGSFLDAELAALERHLNQGGRLVVMLEPKITNGIEGLLRQWKIGVRDDIVADSVSQMLGLGWSGPLIQAAPEGHPITEAMRNSVVMKTVRSLEILAGGEARVEAQPLIQTGRSAWGETALVNGAPKLDDMDHPPPLVVGAVAIRDPGDGHRRHGHAYSHTSGPDQIPEGRLVVFGDTDWMNNRLAPQQGNIDLFLNTINWLAEQEAKITIRPRTRARSQLALSPQDLGTLRFVSMDVLPVLLIAFGLGVVLMRRRR